MKRIFLYIVTNLAVLVVLSIAIKVLGLDRALAGSGFNAMGMLVMAAIMGFGGSLISLAISKWSAKMMTGARIIQVPADLTERWLVDTVARQAKAAGIG